MKWKGELKEHHVKVLVQILGLMVTMKTVMRSTRMIPISQDVLLAIVVAIRVTNGGDLVRQCISFIIPFMSCLSASEFFFLTSITQVTLPCCGTKGRETKSSTRFCAACILKLAVTRASSSNTSEYRRFDDEPDEYPVR